MILLVEYFVRNKYVRRFIKKNCPFEPYQFLEAKMVLEWLLKNVNDSELDKISVCTIMDRVNDYLFNYFYAKSGLKPISKCSIDELKAELEKRNKL